MRHLKWLIALAFGAAVLIVGSLILPPLQYERQEYLGVRPGMQRRIVLEALAKHGVTHVLPMLDHAVPVNIDTLEEITRYKAPGLCISDFANATALTIGFDEQGRVTKVGYGSIRKFEELSNVSTINEVVDKLRPMLERDARLRVSPCIPDRRWIAIATISSEEARYLDQFPVWSFDEPSAYSSARLRFLGTRLEKITYIWRPFEPL